MNYGDNLVWRSTIASLVLAAILIAILVYVAYKAVKHATDPGSQSDDGHESDAKSRAVVAEPERPRQTREPAAEPAWVQRREALRGWWVNQSKETRAWIFLSVAWAVLGVVIVIIFNPAGYGESRSGGGWFFNYYLDQDEYVRALAVLALPLLAWFLRYWYVQLVSRPTPPP